MRLFTIIGQYTDTGQSFVDQAAGETVEKAIESLRADYTDLDEDPPIVIHSVIEGKHNCLYTETGEVS